MENRSLYQCYHAKVLEKKIYCKKGHPLYNVAKDGSVNVRQQERGRPLEFAICQTCPDYDKMGEPIPASERGWIKRRK